MAVEVTQETTMLRIGGALQPEGEEAVAKVGFEVVEVLEEF